MRQRTKNHRNQGSIEKKIRFFSEVPTSHIQMGSLCAKKAIEKFSLLGTFKLALTFFNSRYLENLYSDLRETLPKGPHFCENWVPLDVANRSERFSPPFCNFKGAQAWEFFARVFCTKRTHLGMWLRVWGKKSNFLSNDPCFRWFLVFCRILSVR